MIHFDSSFLVDLLREERRDEKGGAHLLLADLPGDEQACVSIHAVCELYVGIFLATGTREAERSRVERLLATLSIAVPGEDFPSTYGRLSADLQQRGARIATMDLLIATAALCDTAPLVTRNLKHFRRVPGLEVLSY